MACFGYGWREVERECLDLYDRQYRLCDRRNPEKRQLCGYGGNDLGSRVCQSRSLIYLKVIMGLS
jgi:hypothetical protein